MEHRNSSFLAQCRIAPVIPLYSSNEDMSPAGDHSPFGATTQFLERLVDFSGYTSANAKYDGLEQLMRSQMKATI
jgi:hypothetical protein